MMAAPDRPRPPPAASLRANLRCQSDEQIGACIDDAREAAGFRVRGPRRAYWFCAAAVRSVSRKVMAPILRGAP